jgi:hypothetical protein
MDTSSRAEGWPAQLTLPQIVEELVSHRVERWKAGQETVRNPEAAAKTAAMCWDYDSLPLNGPGCLIAEPEGGYAYVPYNDNVSREILPTDLRGRMEMLDRWLRDRENAPILPRLDKFTEKKVNDECFYEFLDGGSAERVDFHGKVSYSSSLSLGRPDRFDNRKQINILAKYRLMETAMDAFDVSPKDPHHLQFRFAITDITEFGNVQMKWLYLDWNCTELEFVKALAENSRPAFDPEAEIPRLLRHLETVFEPEDAAKEAEEYSKELQSLQPVKNEPEWTYFLCTPHEGTTFVENRTWTPLRRQPNDVKMMKRLSREQSKWPIIVRVRLRIRLVCVPASLPRSSLTDIREQPSQPAQWHHYKRCLRVHQLQARQLNHAKEEEKNMLGDVLTKDGKPYVLGN